MPKKCRDLTPGSINPRPLKPMNPLPGASYLSARSYWAGASNQLRSFPWQLAFKGSIQRCLEKPVPAQPKQLTPCVDDIRKAVVDILVGLTRHFSPKYT
jgi:hypothetical protein